MASSREDALPSKAEDSTHICRECGCDLIHKDFQAAVDERNLLREWKEHWRKEALVARQALSTLGFRPCGSCSTTMTTPCHECGGVGYESKANT